jgi:YesN/AraC family two-component response regulator
MSGLELVRHIKEIRPETKVILMSSFIIHMGEFEKVLPSLKIDGVVKKPFTTAELIEAIKKCVKAL